MVQGKQERDKYIALTRRCTVCGEVFPHVYMDDECLSCGATAWEKAPGRRWSTWKGRARAD